MKITIRQLKTLCESVPDIDRFLQVIDRQGTLESRASFSIFLEESDDPETNAALLFQRIETRLTMPLVNAIWKLGIRIPFDCVGQEKRKYLDRHFAQSLDGSTIARLILSCIEPNEAYLQFIKPYLDEYKSSFLLSQICMLIQEQPASIWETELLLSVLDHAISVMDFPFDFLELAAQNPALKQSLIEIINNAIGKIRSYQTDYREQLVALKNMLEFE